MTWFCLGIYHSLCGFTSGINPDWVEWTIVVPFSLTVWLVYTWHVTQSKPWDVRTNLLPWGSGKGFFEYWNTWEEMATLVPLNIFLSEWDTWTCGSRLGTMRAARLWDEADILRLAEQRIRKNLDLWWCHWATELSPKVPDLGTSYLVR